MTAEWYDAWRKNDDLINLTKKQIMEYFNE